jgi:hypothetical protein
MAKPYLSRSQRDAVVKELQSDNHLVDFTQRFCLTESEKSQSKRISRQKLHLRSIARAPPFGLCQRRVIAVALSKVLPISKLYDAYQLFDVLDVMSVAAVTQLKAARSTESGSVSKESTPAPDFIDAPVSHDTVETVVGATDESVTMSVDSTDQNAVSAPDHSTSASADHSLSDFSAWTATALQLMGSLPVLEPLTPGNNERTADVVRTPTERGQSVEPEREAYASVVKRGCSQVEQSVSSSLLTSDRSVEEGVVFPTLSAQRRKRLRAASGVSGSPKKPPSERLVAGSRATPDSQVSLPAQRDTTPVVGTRDNSAVVNKPALGKGNVLSRLSVPGSVKLKAPQGVKTPPKRQGLLPYTRLPQPGNHGQRAACSEIETGSPQRMAMGRDNALESGRSIRIIVSAEMLSAPLTIYLG